MRTTFAALTLLLILAGPSAAVEYRTPAAQQLYTCAADGLSRVAARTVQAPCCDGRLKCAQFLATGGVLKASRDPRT